MKNRLGLKGLILGTALAVGAASLVGCTNYQFQLAQIRSRINSSQLSEGDKKEYLMILNSINPKKPFKSEEDFMELNLRKKRNWAYDQYNEKHLNYLHDIGLIDKNNLSHGDCLYLKKIKIAAELAVRSPNSGQ